MALTRIILKGDLAERFTPELTADIESVHDAVDCLQANYSNFRSYLFQSDELGYGYHVFAGEWQLDQKDLSAPVGSQVIVICPAIIGAGGFGKIILGLGLLGLGLTGVGFLGLSASTLALTGGTLALSGVAGLFATPQTNQKEEQEKKNSLLFGNSVNTAGLGGRVGIVYGFRIEVTSMVLSAGVRTDFILDDSPEESD